MMPIFSPLPFLFTINVFKHHHSMMLTFGFLFVFSPFLSMVYIFLPSCQAQVFFLILWAFTVQGGFSTTTQNLVKPKGGQRKNSLHFEPDLQR